MAWVVAISLATLAATLGIGAATRAWERRSIVPPPPAREISPSTDRLLPRRHLFRPHQRLEHGAGDDPVTAAFERGVAAYNADDADAAADAFEEAVRLAPDASEAHINLGLVYLRLQRPEDAMRELVMGASLAKGREDGK
jgi:tetratricopeptide (TPR) repeat protein